MRSAVDLVCAALRALIRDRRGATVIEYGLVLACIFLALMTGFASVAKGTISLWNTVSSTIQSSIASIQ